MSDYKHNIIQAFSVPDLRRSFSNLLYWHEWFSLGCACKGLHGVVSGRFVSVPERHLMFERFFMGPLERAFCEVSISLEKEMQIMVPEIQRSIGRALLPRNSSDTLIEFCVVHLEILIFEGLYEIGKGVGDVIGKGKFSTVDIIQYL